jgi:hypothetical protein
MIAKKGSFARPCHLSFRCADGVLRTEGKMLHPLGGRGRMGKSDTPLKARGALCFLAAIIFSADNGGL